MATEHLTQFLDAGRSNIRLFQDARQLVITSDLQDPEWPHHLQQLLSLLPSVTHLHLEIKGRRLLPQDILDGIHLPHLSSLVLHNIPHTSVAVFIHNHPHLRRISLGEHCSGAKCPLPRISFSHLMSLSGHASCILRFVTRVEHLNMSISLDKLSKSPSVYRNIRIGISAIMASPSMRLSLQSLTYLNIQINKSEKGFISKIAKTCPRLLLLKVDRIIVGDVREVLVFYGLIY
jgi:hypothetical protein